MTRLACSFTGHRDIPERHKGAIAPLVARAIDYAYREGCRDFYAGGALGFDTVAEREVLAFRLSHPDVRLILLLPCPDQDRAWGGAARDRFRYVLSQADEVRYVCEAYTKTCMRARNERLAELGDLLIAYVGRDRSGSSQTLNMAMRLGKRVYNLYPTLERDAPPDFSCCD